MNSQVMLANVCRNPVATWKSIMAKYAIPYPKIVELREYNEPKRLLYSRESKR